MTTAKPRQARAARVPERRKSARRQPAGRNVRAQKSAARREAILAAALDEFSARGFAATRLDDVARRAGVAKGTIYLHFRDKETLFQELIRSVLSPLVGTLETTFRAELPTRAVADQIVDLFIREVYGTRRKDIIKLIISEGPRFPKLAEFYYREVLSRVLAAARELLQRAIDRGEIKNHAVVRFPQLLVAPGIVAIIWSGLFARFEPLDARAMRRAQLD
ncbi:MAG: TetR/AcrR family transcriptional regulator, partial [Xanthobacteraceae bacterium]|nr:TetR/AcrR family transcriptional regulator [Xanthobacteraceae bacterium]